MSEQKKYNKIEDAINEYLDGETQENALELAAYLSESEGLNTVLLPWELDSGKTIGFKIRHNEHYITSELSTNVSDIKEALIFVNFADICIFEPFMGTNFTSPSDISNFHCLPLLWSDRKNAVIARLTKTATLKFPNACVESIEYHLDRKLSKEQISLLSSCEYIRAKNNVIIMGASGAGKSYMGCALGSAACRKLIRTKYIRLPELLTDLHIARGEGTYKKVIANYKKFAVLILDEWLLAPLSQGQTSDLFEIIESRYSEASTIFIAQSAPAGWYQMIGESRIADAILDRIIHNSYQIMIEGDISMRERMGLMK